MTNSKTTKRALFSSVVALFVCFTMLIGTTFAWFTDSVSSSRNKIQAGTLKIDLELFENGTYTSVRDMTDPIFNYDLWEPGYTEVKTLKIKNEGNLALKYQLNVVAANADCILADVIDVYMCFGENTAESAEDLSDTNKWWKCGTLAEMMANPKGFTQGKLLPAGATYDGDLLGEDGVAIGEITATIALHMQETAGNEYQGLDLGNIDVNLFATQFTYESDSFDDQYDKDAEYDNLVSTANELAEALAAGEDVALAKDIIDIPVNNPAPYGNYYGIKQDGQTINGNGKNLKFGIGEMKDNKYDNYGIMTAGGTIKNVEITGVFRGIMIMNPTEDIYIDNVVIGDEDVCYAINTGEGDGTHSLYVSNSTIKGWNSYGTAIKDVTFTNCTFAQGEYYTDVFGRLVKTYVNAVFENCEFSSKYYIDLSAFEGEKVILRNCTVNGVKLTADNWTSLIVSENDCGDGQISIEAKDGSYMTANQVLLYVIIE